MRQSLFEQEDKEKHRIRDETKKARNGIAWDVHEDIIVARKPLKKGKK